MTDARTDRPWMTSSSGGEADFPDCEVEGQIPAGLSGAFHRVGPDPQFPLREGNIPFDGEGHVSLFRIHGGRVDYRSRYIRNERFVAQERAGRGLFPMYRNPLVDDPLAAGLSRSTANTHVLPHRDLLLALKEDSPPTALDPLTLETRVANYTFDDTLPSLTFTAHPKIDSRTGNLIAFGYEAEGHATNAISIFEYSPQGRLSWNAKIRAPYVSEIHDFAVTDNYIAFFLMPLNLDEPRMARGGIHWSWDATQPSWFGYLRRGGNGSDVRWLRGPTRGMFHVMGCFDDGHRLYVDMPLSSGNLAPFLPQRDGSPYDPAGAVCRLTRVSVDVSAREPRDYRAELLGPHTGTLPRQDDRYTTVPYRYGYLPCPDPDAGPLANPTCIARLDHETGRARLHRGGSSTVMSEFCFAPKSADAAEGEGWLVGVATRLDRDGLRELLILDAQRPDEGPLATVRLPKPIAGQVHGGWTPEWQLPTPAASR